MPGGAQARLLPVGVRELSDDSLMLLIPLRLPEPAFEKVRAEDVRSFVATVAAVGSRLALPVQLLESPASRRAGSDRTSAGEQRLREDFLATFGPGLLPLPASLENSRLFLALQHSPRYMGEGFRQAAIELFTSPVFVLSVALSAMLYFSAWLAPEPLFTKAFAATLTVRLSLLVGLIELARVANAFLLLYQESEAARTPEELEAVSARFGKALGGTGLRVVVAVASMGLGHLFPGAPEAGFQIAEAGRAAVAGGPELGVVAQANIVDTGVIIARGVQAGTALTSACGALNPCSVAMGSGGTPKLSTRYGPPHTRSNPPHNEAIEDELAAREAAGHTSLLKNKAQRSAVGKRVFEKVSEQVQRFRRPDASSVRPDGIRHNINYVSNPRRLKGELEAFESLVNADKRAIHELYQLDGTLVRRYVPAGVTFP